MLYGFILTYNYSGLGNVGRRQFYVNRIARIYPVVLLSLAISAIGVAYAWGNAGLLRNWFSITDHPAVFLGASFFTQLTATIGWFPVARLNQPWNGPAWSITCEFFFYALFPFILAWVRKLSRRTLALASVAAFVAQGALVVGIGEFAPHAVRGFLVSQFPVTHLFEFIIGITAGLFFIRGGAAWLRVGPRRGIALWGSAIVIIALSYFRPIDPMFFPLSPFFAVLILALATRPKRFSILGWGPLVLLGEASFSVYMVHTPLMNMFSMIPTQAAWVGWAFVAVTIGVSVLIFKKFETPARLATKRLLRVRKCVGVRSPVV